MRALLTLIPAALALGMLQSAAPAAERPGGGRWTSVGLSGGGGMHTPAVSPHDRKLMLVNCDMGAIYRTSDGGESWSMIPWYELSSHTLCRPVFHPTDPDTVFAVEHRFYRTVLKVSRDRGVTWKPLSNAPPWKGSKAKLRELAVDGSNGDFLLVGSTDGAWGTSDGGRTWWRCEGLAGEITGLHVDQTSARKKRRCFAGGSEGVFRSDDGGRTWARKVSGLDVRVLERTGGVPALGTSRAAFRYMSLAGGSNAKTGEVMLYVTLPSRVEGGRLVGGVYRSSDAAESWQPAMGRGINTQTRKTGEWGNGPVAQYSWALTTNVRPRTVYVTNTSTGYEPPNHTTVYRSDDSGRKWRAVFYSDPRFKKFNVGHDYKSIAYNENDQDPARGLAINAADPEMVIFTNDGQCFATTNGGRSWEALHARRAPGRPEPPAPPAPAAGRKWLNTGLTVTTTWQHYFDPFEPRRRYISYTDIGFARSTDGGRTWIHGLKGVPWRTNQYELAFDPEVRGKLWGAFAVDHDRPIRSAHLAPGGNRGGSGVALSLDHGATWKTRSEGLPGKGPVTSIVLDPKSPRDGRTLWAGCFGSGVYKSTDGGRRWRRSSGGLGAEGSPVHVYRLRLHADGTLFCSVAGLKKGRRMLAADRGGAGIYRSTDRGASWRCISAGAPARWIMDFDVDPADSRVVYFGARAGNSAGLYKTADGGRTWKRVAREGPEHFGAFVHPRRRGWVYMTLAEDNPGWTLWLSRDAGGTWKPFKDFPFQKPLRVAFHPTDDSVIFVTTFGGGVWRGPAEPEQPEERTVR